MESSYVDTVPSCLKLHQTLHPLSLLLTLTLEDKQFEFPLNYALTEPTNHTLNSYYNGYLEALLEPKKQKKKKHKQM